ncbi:hypothetical protein BD410DRAFT_716835 [Rickenella mellea]|uniref:Pre-mRNA-splicing factor CWC24 n=1 Tax=Rickenella mellea TaxID=50990 RepID=A0A4Y7QFZ1_9AGAM|nr:hypothetical protein BD410DRAFT_716835 [Rickenella mellea]
MSTEPAVPFFKKGKSRPTNNRRRSVSPTLNGATNSGPSRPMEGTSSSVVVLPSRKAAANLLSAGTKRTSSQRDETDEVEREGPDVKWTAAGSHQNAAQEILDGDEAEEILAKRARKARADAGEEDADIPDDGLYRGQAAYKSHLKKNQEVPKAMRVGPQRNTSTIRTVTIVDYQPDVCKDYKETGYCGFGDTCKFLHDRGTYLAGWQLDKLAAEPKGDARDESDSDSDDEDIPFACLICRKPYTDPVVTRCGHYYCSACAIKRFAKTPKCLACGSPTGGIFNRADKVIAKMEMKRKEEKEAEQDSVAQSNDVELEGLGGTGDDDDDSHSSDE